MRKLLLLISFMCCSCFKSQESAHRSSIRLSMCSEPASLDPRKARDLNGRILIQMLFEPLLNFSKEGVIEMGAAESFELLDEGRRYLFHLRESYWSNGDPVTADDFVFAWSSILDPSFPGDLAYQLYPIKNAKKAFLGEIPFSEVGIKALNARTLEIVLEEPLPYFLNLLTMTSFSPVPRRVVMENPHWAMEASGMVSNGPFCLKEWTHTDQVKIKKNERYWQKDQILLEEAQFIIMPPETGLKMLDEGKLDWTGSPLASVPSDSVRMLQEEGRLEVAPFLGTAFLRVNVEAPMVADSFLRRALGLALDRSAIVNHLLQGGQQTAQRLVPSCLGLDEEGYFSDHDVESARKALSESLSHQTIQKPIVLSYPSSERNASMAQAIQQQWQTVLGIPIQLEAVEIKTYFQKIARRDYQIALGSWIADVNDPVDFLNVFKYKTNGPNNTGWENSDYVDLLDRSSVCNNQEKRKELLREAERILMEQMPVIPLYHLSLNYTKHPNLSGIVVSSQGGLDLRKAHWEGLR